MTKSKSKRFLKEAEDAYQSAIEDEVTAYNKMRRAIDAYDLARNRAIQNLKAFGAAMKLYQDADD